MPDPPTAFDIETSIETVFDNIIGFDGMFPGAGWRLLLVRKAGPGRQAKTCLVPVAPDTNRDPETLLKYVLTFLLNNNTKFDMHWTIIQVPCSKRCTGYTKHVPKGCIHCFGRWGE